MGYQTIINEISLNIKSEKIKYPCYAPVSEEAFLRGFLSNRINKIVCNNQNLVYPWTSYNVDLRRVYMRKVPEGIPWSNDVRITDLGMPTGFE